MSDPAVTVKNHAKAVKVFNKMWLLKERSEFVDATLMSNDGYSCPVHACVVAAQSDFLHQVLAQHVSKQQHKDPIAIKKKPLTSEVLEEATSSHDREKLVDKQEPMNILLQELSSFMLQICIEYMYGKEVTFSYANVNDVIKAADYLKIEQLESQCQEIIEELVIETKGDRVSFLSSNLNKNGDTNTGGKVLNMESEPTSAKELCQNKSESNLEVRLDTDKSDKHSTFAARPTPKNTKPSDQVSDPEEIVLYFDSASGQLKTFQSSGSEVAELDSRVMSLIGGVLMQEKLQDKEEKSPSSAQSAYDKKERKREKSIRGPAKKRNASDTRNKSLQSTSSKNPAKQKEIQRQTSDADQDPDDPDFEPSEDGENDTSDQETDAVPTVKRANIRKSAQNTDTANNIQAKARPKKKYYPPTAARKERQKEYNKRKEFICTLCGLKCLGKIRLDAHVSVVHERKYLCKYCNRAMVKERSLREHEARHERRFLMMCDQCDYQCYSSSDLSYHKKSRHSGERHECDICKAAYTTRTALCFHKATHREPLKCDQCDFTAFYKYKLRNHVEAMHTPTVAECNLCERVFPNMHRAREHVRKYHAELFEGLDGGDGQIVADLRHPVPAQDNKYGTVEFDAGEASQRLGKAEKIGDGRINSYVTKRLQSEKDRNSLERSRNMICAARNKKRKSTNPKSDTIPNEELISPNIADPDMTDVNMALVQQEFDFDEHGDNIVYIEAGTGRIVSESEVKSRQLQIISSEYAGEYVGEGVEGAQMEVHAELVQM